jgi:radical SAM superfamily enzyme YgiQ (UPF0313 family)
MTDLVLCRPGITQLAEHHWSDTPPLGLGYLAANARANGFDVQVVDGKMLLHRTPAVTAAEILRHRPRVVGLSAMTFDYPLAIAMARYIKQHDARIDVVLGGVHANALPHEPLLECESFDYVIAGEAEHSLVELLRAAGDMQRIRGIPGLHHRDAAGRVINHVPASYETDIATLPFPAWDLFPRAACYPVMWERGCPFFCVFCSRNMQQKVRSRPVGHVIKEIAWLAREFHPRAIFFQDETFGLHYEQTCELLDRLALERPHGAASFTAQTRVDQVDRRMLAKMREAGFDYLELGVESGDPTVLRKSGKAIRLPQVEEAVFLSRAVGLKVWLKFIIGLPGETRDTIRQSTELAVRLNPDRISVSVIVAYPGSKIFEWASTNDRGYRLLGTNWDDYDKYLAKSVELENLSHGSMQLHQLRMYLEVYVRNGRLLECARLLWKARSIVSTMLVNIIRDLASRHRNGEPARAARASV